MRCDTGAAEGMSQSIDEVLLGTPARGAGDGDEEGEGEGDKFVRQLFESLLLGTRASNAIPDGEGQEVGVPGLVRVVLLLLLLFLAMVRYGVIRVAAIGPSSLLRVTKREPNNADERPQVCDRFLKPECSAPKRVGAFETRPNALDEIVPKLGFFRTNKQPPSNFPPCSGLRIQRHFSRV